MEIGLVEHILELLLGFLEHILEPNNQTKMEYVQMIMTHVFGDGTWVQHQDLRILYL